MTCVKSDLTNLVGSAVTFNGKTRILIYVKKVVPSGDAECYQHIAASLFLKAFRRLLTDFAS